jgi:hypothetical protein
MPQQVRAEQYGAAQYRHEQSQQPHPGAPARAQTHVLLCHFFVACTGYPCTPALFLASLRDARVEDRMARRGYCFR